MSRATGGFAAVARCTPPATAPQGNRRDRHASKAGNREIDPMHQSTLCTTVVRTCQLAARMEVRR